MQHFLKIGGKRYGEVRNFKKVRKFASSNLKFRSSKFKFTEILICNPGLPPAARHRAAAHEPAALRHAGRRMPPGSAIWDPPSPPRPDH